jgi:serine/alanine racemase
MKKQYYALDFAKFLAAILIIVLHTQPMLTFNSKLEFITRHIVTILAVPFFFICSAFIFFLKLRMTKEQNQAKKHVLHFIKRIGIMYLIWSGIYFIFIWREWITNGITAHTIIQYIKRFIFEGSYATIWFLPALLSATLLVYLLQKRLSVKIIFIISLFTYVFTCFASSYYALAIKIPAFSIVLDSYYNLFDTVKNGFLFGFTYVSLGALIASKEEVLLGRFTLRNSSIFAGIFLLLMGGEATVLTVFKLSTKGVDTIFFLVPVSFFIFLVLLNLNIHLKESSIYLGIRELSLLMFLSQRIFLTIYPEIFPKLGLSVFIENTMLYFISILFSTLVFSQIIIIMSKRVKALKYLY